MTFPSMFSYVVKQWQRYLSLPLMAFSLAILLSVACNSIHSNTEANHQAQQEAEKSTSTEVQSEPLVVTDNEQTSQKLEQYLTDNAFNGAALIFENDQITLNKGFGLANRAKGYDNNADTVFRLGSVTKQITATAIMLLHQQGKLNIVDTIDQYIPSYPNGDRITITHLLQHTAGIKNYTSFANFGTIMRDYYTAERLIGIFKNLPLEFNPGSEMRYSNSGYALLGYLIEQVSGLPYAEFVQQEIFTPLGMTNSGYGANQIGDGAVAQGYGQTGNQSITIDMSVPFSAGALVSTVNDMHLWMLSFNQQILLSAESQDIMFSPALNNYGFGWDIREQDGILLNQHGGAINGFSSFVARYPTKNKHIILLSNEEGVNLYKLIQGLAAL